MATTDSVDNAATAPRPRGSILSAIHLPGWMSTLLHNRKASFGLAIMVFFICVAVFAGQLTNIDPTRRVGRPSEAPTAAHIFGTTRDGKDVFAQVIYGSRVTLAMGFATGSIVIVIAIIMGLTAGYLGGVPDEVISLFTNIFLILPSIPLIIVIAGWLEHPGPVTVMLVLSAISWAYGARVLRSQALVLRNSEFVAAAKVVGEPSWRIILYEILPNMTSLVASSWIGAVQYSILALVTLEFLGLGDVNIVTWGTILFWAQNNQALLTGAWWTFIPPGVCIAMIGLALTMINYGIDEITNPRLRTEAAAAKVTAATAVVRRKPVARAAEGQHS